MRAIILALTAALALGGCSTLVTPVVDDLTGTTLEERCPGYLLDLQLAREALTIAAPGSPEADRWALRVATLQSLVDLYCIRAEPEPGLVLEDAAVDSGSPP